MAMTVRTNVASISAQKTLGRTSQGLQKTLGRISSGLRIQSAADDAAGLGVATNMETARTSYSQAMRNANDGISVIQTAEGATDETTDILQRMRELAVQSSSETLEDGERAYIQKEAAQLSSEMERIANVTEFNSTQLTDGTNTSLAVQVGIDGDANSQIDITLGDLRVTALEIRVVTFSADTAGTVSFTASGGTAATTATGALGNSAATVIASTASLVIDLSTSERASASLAEIDEALDTVNSYRADYGAVQNRLDSAVNSAQNYSENLASAESQIRDADFAAETSEMTKQQIMSQAGIAALSQAKNINQSVVSLLN